MTPDNLRHLIAQTGDDRRHLARMLGYASENTLRQCESGRQSLPPDKAEWLERYAKFRVRQIKMLVGWMGRNPPPARVKQILVVSGRKAA